jgi:hypothetical protein
MKSRQRAQQLNASLRIAEIALPIGPLFFDRMLFDFVPFGERQNLMPATGRAIFKNLLLAHRNNRDE